jgi:hypothetical protein
VIELVPAMPAAAVKLAIREVTMVPHNSAAQIVVFQGCQGTAGIWWVDKAGDLRFVRRASWHRRRFVPINALVLIELGASRMLTSRKQWRDQDLEILDLLLDPNGPGLTPGGVFKRLKYAVHAGDANPRCVPGGGNDQNGRTCSHFLAALTFAQRALCAAAILLRPAAEMVLFFRLDFLPRR